MRSSRVRSAYRTGRSGKVRDGHLLRRREPGQNPEGWPASKKGVIRYGLVNTSRTIEPHGERECARRRRQIAEGRLTASNGLVR